ncbi:MAG: hypothetical protein A2X05_16855 [Bacteroidetes bacterium GWE2_41_25]|nr:MAG: hypothetical protein A2X03_19180 [Bacteroidetes bacterium GWA2_40_15]OFX86748.1 MAG: hypothetical protein A2X06_17810 [Bacteroidetes bacterium GWC2_40_22]OFY06934.1 MAG: hypothetical protein A2X05_16855 [Bacteroidetes bacterium GWE2_41_25]OFY56669.1 MAG: hypothetical protein A2X04_10795 [Bacteroidetes bacterium GWF2_41_9]HAM09471.1 hypothetical protein [Bacteroidales bacterium]
MKRFLTIISLLLYTGFILTGQSSDPFVSKCVMNTGNEAKYLKDFRIQLGKAAEQNDLRYKANMSLWKNTKYRFTMCSAEDSKGQLILSIKDDANKVILSSYDKKTGKTYPFVDFVCNKSGIYKLNYDFTDGQQGSGVGVVSMVK